MKVTIIGANGKVGRLIAQRLQANGHEPIAMVREARQQAYFNQQGIATVVGDLHQDSATLATILEGSEAVVFTAGSGGSTGADQTMLIDLDGAVKAIEASKQAAIGHFVMVSAIGAHRWLTDHPAWLDLLEVYYAAKFYADSWLQSSGLAHTIVRPGGLTDGDATGKVTIGESLEPKPIARADVAEVVVTVLEHPTTQSRAFDLVAGEDSPIQALNSLSE